MGCIKSCQKVLHVRCGIRGCRQGEKRRVIQCRHSFHQNSANHLSLHREVKRKPLPPKLCSTVPWGWSVRQPRRWRACSVQHSHAYQTLPSRALTSSRRSEGQGSRYSCSFDFKQEKNARKGAKTKTYDKENVWYV